MRAARMRSAMTGPGSRASTSGGKPHGGRRCARRAQQRGLRVGPRAQLRSAAARVGLAGEQEALEAFGAAECVGDLEQFEDGAGALLARRDARARGGAPPARASSRCSFGTRRRVAMLLDEPRAGCPRGRCGAASARAASGPCRGRAPAPRSAPSCRARARPRRPAPASCARRCRSPDATAAAAARRTARRSPGRPPPARRRRAAPRSTRPGCASPSARSVSTQTRSGTSAPISPDATMLRISSSVSGATVKPSGAKRAAKRATRSTRSGSSTNAGETWRSRRASRSRRPPYGSTISPRRGLRHGVDREVAAREVLLERHVGREARREAVVAGAGLPLGARERVLFAGVGVQEDREVLADRPVAAARAVRPAWRRRRRSRARRGAGRAAGRAPRRRRGRCPCRKS